MAKFKQYIGQDGTREEFIVFLIHGHSEEWRKVKQYIENVLNFRVKAIVDEVGTDTLINEVRKAIWDCDCAIAIMSGDDIMINNSKYSRPNVMFEIGYTMGFFDHLYWEDDDLNAVLLVREKDTYIPTDLAGIKYEQYDKQNGIERSFGYIKGFIDKTFEQVKEYYKE
jgi:predicted nucleotide-binding protein